VRGGKRGSGGRGRNDPNIVCTYEYKKKIKIKGFSLQKNKIK
jgi:hypothetical protein